MVVLSRCLSFVRSLHSASTSRLACRPRSGLRRAAGVLAVLVPGLAIAACGSSSSSSPTNAAAVSTASNQVPLSKPQTITWAIQGGISGGLGSEGQKDREIIASFEKAYPNIKVDVETLSSTSLQQAQSQVQQHFIARDGTPEMIDGDPTWVAPWAVAGFILPMSDVGVTSGELLPPEATAGTFDDKLYGASWFDGAEGLYYRKDLIKTAPKTPQQLVADCAVATKEDPKLKECLAFEADAYEGANTVLSDVLNAFGGSFDPANFDTSQNLQGLTWLHALVYQYKIAPRAVTGWQEGQTDQAFQSGQAAFETNWPFVAEEDYAKSSTFPLSGKNAVGYVPFPTMNGKGVATQGGDMLLVNADNTHIPATAALVKWILAVPQQQLGMVVAGDPPAVAAAYTASLLAKAPYLKEDEQVLLAAVPRPLSAHYLTISQDVYEMTSSVLANQKTPAAALKATATEIKPLAN